MLLDEVVGSGEHADGVLAFADVTFETQHPDVRVLIKEAFVVTHDCRIKRALVEADGQASAIVCVQISRAIIQATIRPKVLRPRLAGKLDRHVRIDNRARVYRGDRRLENVYAFKKERPLFRKENRKTLVGGNYELICLDLSEVRIDRQVERSAELGVNFAVRPGSIVTGSLTMRPGSVERPAYPGKRQTNVQTCRSAKASGWESTQAYVQRRCLQVRLDGRPG